MVFRGHGIGGGHYCMGRGITCRPSEFVGPAIFTVASAYKSTTKAGFSSNNPNLGASVLEVKCPL